MRLSEHFTLEEFTKSQIAARNGIDNTPSKEVIENLKRTAEGLELVRSKLDNLPIYISSGFRCEAVNDILGSKRTSQHIRGEAADITCSRFGSPMDMFEVLIQSSIPFDQCILEFNSWVHISFTENPRRKYFVIDKEGVKTWQKEIQD
jgi:hypothetical protein